MATTWQASEAPAGGGKKGGYKTPDRRRVVNREGRNDVDRHADLQLLQPGKLLIAAYPNFFPVCYYAQRGDKSGASAGLILKEGEGKGEAPPGAAVGRFAGLEVDLLRKFCGECGLEPEFVAAPDFLDIWTYPGQGMADVAIGGITSSPTRDDPAIRWSAPYYTVTRTLVYHRRSPTEDFAFPAGVNGIIRGTPGSTGYLDAAARMTAHGKRHLLHDSCNDEEDIRALLRQEIQGMVRGSSVGRAIVLRHPEHLAMLEPWMILPDLSPTPKGEVFCLPTRSESNLADCLTEILARERESGGLQALLAEHRLLAADDDADGLDH